MSLVNDALRRAKQHTAQPAPAANLQLRPIEPAAENTAHGTRKFPLVFTVIGIVVVALLITGFFQATNHDVPVQAATAPVQLAKPAVPAASVKTPAVVAPAPRPAVEAKAITSPVTNAPAMVVQAPAPKVLPPKLQAIFFNNNRPSAMIDGRTVYVGNRVRDYRVAAITPNSATLVSGAVTNILSFQE